MTEYDMRKKKKKTRKSKGEKKISLFLLLAVSLIDFRQCMMIMYMCNAILLPNKFKLLLNICK